MRFPGSGLYESWRTCKVLLPHARAVLQHDPEADAGQIKRAMLRRNVARYDFDQGRYQVALDEAKEAYRIAQKLLASQDPLTLSITNQLTAYLIVCGKHKEARELAQLHGPFCVQVLGVEHLDTLACYSYIAWLLKLEGKTIGAEDIYRVTLECQKTVLGGDHPNTLRSMCALADFMRSRKK